MRLLMLLVLSALTALGQNADPLEGRKVQSDKFTQLSAQIPKSWIPFRSSLPGVFFSVISLDRKYAFMASEFFRSDPQTIEDAIEWTKQAAEAATLSQVSHEELTYTAPAGYVAHEHITVHKIPSRNERVATRLRILTSRDGRWMIKYSITRVYPEGTDLPSDFFDFSRRVMSTVTFTRGRPL